MARGFRKPSCATVIKSRLAKPLSFSTSNRCDIMGNSLRIQFASLTDVGRVRSANEDNLGHAEYPWGQLFTVCDGMGGHVGGAKASHIAVSSILEFMARNDAADPIASLNQAVRFANEQIYATALNQRELKGMGTTCTVLLQKESGIWLAHVGDSRIYILSDRQLHKVTRDHSFVQGLVDEGLIAEEDAESHPRKNELKRALGIGGDVDVEVTQQPIFPKKGDVFLLCSDGLNGMVSDRNIEQILNGPGSLQEKVKTLIDAANAGGGNDNITVQLVEVLDSPHLANKFVAIKPPINLARTMPVQEDAEAPAAPMDTRTVLQKYWVAIVFCGVILVAGVIGAVMMGGGPSKEEIRAKFVKDSTAKAEKEDSIRNVKMEEAQRKIDSAYVADVKKYEDSLAHKQNPKTKPIKPEPLKLESFEIDSSGK
jgi:serine/threonine protein phosphatase PrpC